MPWSRSQQVDQSHASVYGVLGEAVLATGDADRGAKMIKEALKHDIDNRERLERAVELVSPDPSLLYNMIIRWSW